jgi:hypothetical protein
LDYDSGMSRRRKHEEERGRTPQATHWVWAGILGVLAGGIYYSVQGGAPISFGSNVGAATSTVQTSITETIATSTIELGIAAPKGDRDQVYSLSFPGKTVEQQSVEKGWRLDTWKRHVELYIIPASPDGSAPILTDGGEWNIPLRSGNGEAYGDARLAGAADETHVFVLASADVRKLLLVSRSGEIRSIYDVADYANALPTSDNHAWFATFVPGEGIESQPTGPSRLIRVSVSGIQETMAEESRLIASVMPGPEGALAYRTDDGDVVAAAVGKRWSGSGVPLLWLDENRLLLGQGRTVFLLDMRTLTLDQLQQLPAAPSAARML